MNPKMTVAIVHNADYGEMDALLKLSSNLVLLTLSPHVAKALAQGTGKQADWMLPVYPVRPDPDCTAVSSDEGGRQGGEDQPCLRGFAMQARSLLNVFPKLMYRFPSIRLKSLRIPVTSTTPNIRASSRTSDGTTRQCGRRFQGG